MNEKINREAADWVVRFDEGERAVGSGEQSRWLRWLQRSPGHVQSYLDTADVYERLRQMDPESRIDVDEWLAGGKLSVTSLEAFRATSVLRPAPRYRTRRWSIAAAVAVVATTAVIGWQLSRGEVYRTGAGQQSLYRLADGSVLNLNTRSKARILFSDTKRLIELDGEALITVAPDPARPFYVQTSGAMVQALGTRFNVYELPGETRVTVVEGLVRVSSDGSIDLSAGEAARVSDGKVHQITANVNAAIAWEHQKLVFEDASLVEVAAEFNRYNDSQIQIRGVVVQQKRLSGTFDALHPKSLLLYLERDADILVQQSGKNFVVRGR